MNIKDIFPFSSVGLAIRNYKIVRNQKKQYKIWKKNGKPNPPPHWVKQLTIKKYKGTHLVLLETGTFMGDMVEAMKNEFQKIWSIELSTDFYLRAVNRFKKDKSVKIYEGDSAQVLASILTQTNESILFWLDGHYSGDDTALGNKVTPVENELKLIHAHIQEHGLKHTIIIDDARLFVGKDDYPTLDYMQTLTKDLFPRHSLLIENDSIILLPI